MGDNVKILLGQNVMFGGQHYGAGEVVEVEAGVAEQIVGQGLGEVVGEGAAIDEPESQDEEPTSPPPSPRRGGKGK